MPQDSFHISNAPPPTSDETQAPTGPPPGSITLRPDQYEAPAAPAPPTQLDMSQVPKGSIVLSPSDYGPQRRSQTMQEYERQYEEDYPWYERFARGMGKAGTEGLLGANALVRGAAKKMGVDIPMADFAHEDLQQRGIAEHLGGFAENAIEFEAAGAALKGLGLLGRLATSSPRLLTLAQNNPVVARMLVDAFKEGKILPEMLKAGGAGAITGAVHGAPTGQAEAEAVGGGIGGAIGGAVGPLTGWLGKHLWSAGLTAEEAMVKAGRPYVTEADKFKKALQVSALPLLNEVRERGMRTIGDFVNIIGDTADKVRNNVFNPMIARWGNDYLNGWTPALEIWRSITQSLRDYKPGEVRAMRKFAYGLTQTTKRLADWEGDLQFFNGELRDFYRSGPRDQNGELVTNANVRRMEAMARGLRDMIYNHLEVTRREPGARAAQILWGSLKDLENSFAKRATVVERQNPITLPRFLGALSTIAATGHALLSHGTLQEFVASLAPMALVIAHNIRNAPENLVKIGLRTAAEEAGTPTLRTKLIDRPTTWLVQHVPQWIGALGGRGIGERMSEPSLGDLAR